MDLALGNYFKATGRIYNVGIYSRLSSEDNAVMGKAIQSESIKNQREMLTRFVLENNWNIIEYYCDDGYTGLNFNRPAFLRMLDDIKSNKINMVVSKDLSRLGRDYIQTGYYLEKFFPENKIRYIAVNDGIDTLNNNCANDITPFKSVLNDMYAKDISKKVRSAIDIKKRTGKFIGAFAPYGYQKSVSDKNKLIIDPEVAPMVKEIFNMFVSGHGYTYIASFLNSEGVLSPTMFKELKSNYKNAKAKHQIWTAETIKCILINPTYMGNLTQNRQVRVSYKVNKLQMVPRNEWVIVENTHDAIVDNETFSIAQSLIKRNSSIEYSSKKRPHLLAGMIFCGDCGGRMTFAQPYENRVYCICIEYKRFKKCSRHTILESDVEAYVLNDLRSMANMVINKDRLEKIALQKRTNNKLIEISNEINRIENRLSEIKRAIKSLYDDKLRGIINENDFVNLTGEYNKEREKLVQKLEGLNAKRECQQKNKEDEDTFLNLVKNIIEFQDVDRVAISKLISKVEIFEDKRIVIHYRFKSPFLR